MEQLFVLGQLKAQLDKAMAGSSPASHGRPEVCSSRRFCDCTYFKIE